MGCFIVYTVDASSVTIRGVFSNAQSAMDLFKKIEDSGNPNVWVVSRAMDSENPLPHKIEI